MENTNTFIERSGEIAKLKELNKESYEEAVRRSVDALGRAASFRKRASELAALGKQLGLLAFDYAKEHNTALTSPLCEYKGKTLRGAVVFGDESKYTLTVGIGDPKRIDGSNMTEAFLQTLPDGWTKMKLEAAVDAIKNAAEAERNEYGLVCQPTPTWKLAKD